MMEACRPSLSRTVRVHSAVHLGRELVCWWGKAAWGDDVGSRAGELGMVGCAQAFTSARVHVRACSSVQPSTKKPLPEDDAASALSEVRARSLPAGQRGSGQGNATRSSGRALLPGCQAHTLAHWAVHAWPMRLIRTTCLLGHAASCAPCC